MMNIFDDKQSIKADSGRKPAEAKNGLVQVHPWEKYGVKIHKVRALNGPNLYAYFRVLHIVMDVGPYEERSSETFPGFVERLVDYLPGLENHECNLGRPGGFIERLRRGTYLGHICEHITLELQNMMGFPVSFGRARGTGKPGVYNVIIQFKEEESARAAFETALRLCLAAMHNEPFDMKTELETLLEIADDYRLGPSTAAIVAAAHKRDIPVIRLTPTGSLVQLGYGIYQKRILASETSLTSAIAVEMCQEKALTNQMLGTVGVPVPEGDVVSSADEACALALGLGFPVVVKPYDGNQGKGVSVKLHTESEVRDAFELAVKFSSKALVEKYIEGDDYRLLVVNGKLVAGARRDAAHVIGDGSHTISELIEIANQDPRRRPGHSSSLTRLVLDDSAKFVLSQQNLTAESIPEAEQKVKLRTNSNLSTGGTASDITDIIHPRNVQLAQLAAQILAMDVAGIDIICRDIRRPLPEQDGAVVEVNAAPGLRMHLFPSEGQARNVGEPIVEMLFPDNAPSRIPIFAVTGTNGKTTVTRLIAYMYETARYRVGMTTTNGVYINQERITGGDSSGPKSAKTVLLHPQVEVAVLETARGGILREGLGFDCCKVGIVTNVSADHLGLDDIHTLDDLVRVKQVVIESVAPDGVAILNADDPLVAEMAAATDAEVIYFGLSRENHIIAAHLAEDGRAVFLQDDKIILSSGSNEVELVELARVPFTNGGIIKFQVVNALTAVAAAWAAGLNPAMIVRALSTFASDTTTIPGRFNMMSINGVEVILDYAHNPAAISALMAAVNAMPPRHTTMIIGLPGDRRDEDLIHSMQATVEGIDSYILHDLQDRRERQPNEVPQLLRQQIPDGVACEIVSSQEEGIKKALSRLEAGQRLIIVADIVDESIEVLERIQGYEGNDIACGVPNQKP
jgi:cyanophycin synthetase